MIRNRIRRLRKEAKVNKYDGYDILSEWVNTYDSCIDAANDIGVCSGTISNWLTGFRRPSLSMCMRIESVTNGKVKASDIRPDLTEWDRK